LASWQQVVDSAPEFARTVQQMFDARVHKTMATLRKDGSPRISGIECEFEDGQLRFGSMKGSVKSLDLTRDPRLALHSPSIDPPKDPSQWPGEAKITGRAIEITNSSELGSMETHGGHAYRIDLTEVVLTRVGGMDHLIIEHWHEDRGLVTSKRYN
jgi:Pyridoxamine 5'-phosphate oxidase